MSLTPAIIDALVASGASAEVIAAVVKADMNDRENRLNEKRANDAERQRRHRLSRDVTVTECDNIKNTPSPSPSPSSPPYPPNNPTHTHTPVNNKTRACKGTRLPSDWKPNPLPLELASEVLKWADGAVERELARFRDWAESATGTNAVKKNWDAAWRNWLRKANDDGRTQTGRPENRNGSNPRPQRVDGFTAACREVIDRFPGEGNYPPDDRC